MKIKITHLGFTRNDPRRMRSGRITASRAPRKTPIIGNLHFKEGMSKWVGPQFYVRYESQLKQYIDLGIIRVEIPPARKKEWLDLCAAHGKVLPAEQIRLAAEKSQQEALAVERKLREQAEAAKAKADKEAREAAKTAAAADVPDMNAARDAATSGVIGMLNSVPPVEMTESQVKALKSKQSKPKAAAKKTSAKVEPVKEVETKAPVEEAKPASKRRRRTRRAKETKSE